MGFHWLYTCLYQEVEGGNQQNDALTTTTSTTNSNNNKKKKLYRKIMKHRGCQATRWLFYRVLPATIGKIEILILTSEHALSKVGYAQQWPVWMGKMMTIHDQSWHLGFLICKFRTDWAYLWGGHQHQPTANDSGKMEHTSKNMNTPCWKMNLPW